MNCYSARIHEHAEQNPAFSCEGILTHLNGMVDQRCSRVNRYVCDWLQCSTLKKHVVNRNVWCSPELKHKFSPERLPNLYKMYPIITTWGAFHCVRQWTCGVRVWEKCPLHESHAECVRVGSPALVLVSYHSS